MVINLTINDRPLTAAQGQTILEVAREHDIFIPSLCFHQALRPVGSCRICLVEVSVAPRPLPACTTVVSEGLRVITSSPKLEAIRQELLKLVLINHAVECPICDKGGECELQNLTHTLGIEKVDLAATKIPPHDDYVSPLVERHNDRCVTCGRCVRICQDRVGAWAWNFVQRGYFTELDSGGLPLECEFCGSCIDICPVGALINKMWKYRARAWEVTKTEMVCPFCGGGCTYEIHTKNRRIMRVRNEETVLLCARGRFGSSVVESPDRLQTPLIGEPGAWHPATWEEALDLVSEKFQEIIDSQGPAAIYGIGSPRATNEANYLFQKFFRAGLGTNQMDNPGRYNYLRALEGLAAVFGWPQVSGVEAPSPNPPLPYHSPWLITPEAQGSGFQLVLGRLADLPQADLALVVGADVTPELPPLGWALHAARERDDFRLLVANPRRTKFDRYAHLSLRYHPGSERWLIAGIVKALLAAHPGWVPLVPAANLDGFKESLKKIREKEVLRQTGLEQTAIQEAVGLLTQSRRPAIIFGTELLEQDKGLENAVALADLFLLVGRPGMPGSALYPVAEKNNSRGVCEVGVLPDRLPGFLSLDAPGAESFWVNQPATTKPGLTLRQMLALLEEGDPAAPQGLYLLGGDLVRWLPNRSRTEKALKKLKFMVVQDAFLTDTARLAHVILPVAIHAEQEGTFISSDGTLGVLPQVLPANGVRPDWQIICQLSSKLGYSLAYRHPREIFQELAQGLPLWASLAPKGRVPALGLKTDLTGKFIPIDLDIGLPGRRPYILTVGRALFHSGSYTTHHPCGPLTVMDRSALRINPEDAQNLALAEGDAARVTSSQGEINVPVTLAPELPPGVVFLPNHFALPPAHLLTLDSNLVRVTIRKA